MKYLFTILILSLFSCSQEIKNEKKLTKVQKSLTSDSLGYIKNNKSETNYFVLEDLKNLDFISDLYWDFDNLYFKKDKKNKFEKIDLKPNLKVKEYEWLPSDQHSFIIAKFNYSTKFKTLLIKLYGTDYAGLILVNVQNQKIISLYPIYSLENSGFELAEDSLIITRPKTLCEFKGNKLFLKKMVGKCNPINIKDYTPELEVEEINYETTIEKNGLFKEIEKNRKKYIKKMDLTYFNSY